MTTAQLAALLEGTNANKTMNFNEEELEFLASTINTSKRTTKHQRKIDLLVARWFMTIKVHGGEIMQHLLKMEPADYCQGKKQDFAFFNLVGGPKSADKTIILNKCLAHPLRHEVALFEWQGKRYTTCSSKLHQVHGLHLP